MRHANLAIFVPHAGCPRQCSFCNQKSISGAREAPTGKSVAALCAESARALAGADTDAEIAFFGGSFTAIGRDYMLELLEAAAPFVGGAFRGIRISTRPDAVDGETLGLLRRYGVTAVELGAQSMDDGVLDQNLRGHTAADVERAAGLVRDAGFELGLQMMTGLYGSDEARDFMTAERLAACAPDTVRVYPTVVMEGTGLAALWRAGTYRPQTLGEAVSLGARLLEFFEGKGVRVIPRAGAAGRALPPGVPRALRGGGDAPTRRGASRRTPGGGVPPAGRPPEPLKNYGARGAHR